jgi:hypothetical protein
VSAPEFELPSVELPFQLPSLPAPVVPGGVEADGGVLIFPAAGADAKPDYLTPEDTKAGIHALLETASFLLNLVPVVGEVKMAVEAAVGITLTGMEMAGWERGVQGASVVPLPEGHTPGLAALHKIHKGAHVVNEVVHALHVAHAWEEVGEQRERTKRLYTEDEGEEEQKQIEYPEHAKH